MVWNGDAFRLAVANVHARAVRSRLRDGFSAEVLLGFSDSPAAPVTVLGRVPRMVDLQDSLPAPTGITLLPGYVREHLDVTTCLIDENDVTAVCYTRGHPEQDSRLVRTVGVWPEEMVVVTHLTDLASGVKVDPSHPDPASVRWEDWVARMIPVRQVSGSRGPGSGKS